MNKTKKQTEQKSPLWVQLVTIMDMLIRAYILFSYDKYMSFSRRNKVVDETVVTHYISSDGSEEKCIIEYAVKFNVKRTKEGNFAPYRIHKAPGSVFAYDNYVSYKDMKAFLKQEIAKQVVQSTKPSNL